MRNACFFVCAFIWGCEPDTGPLQGGENDPTTPALPTQAPPEGVVEEVPEGLMPEQDPLFRDDFVHEIRFTLSPASESALTSLPREYAPVRIDIDGQVFEVEMRLKGSSTFSPLTGKPSMKVRVDQLVPGQEIFGHEGFNLHNQSADQSFMGEHLSYYITREAGLPSMQTGYAIVAINGVYKGLYGITQRKDQEWLDTWYDDPTGSIYEGVRTEMTDPVCPDPQVESWSCWTLDHAGDTDSPADIPNLNNRLTNPPDMWVAVESAFEMDDFINGLATEMVIGHWDSYSGNGNNTHIYHQPATDTWHMSPWSQDLAFGRPVWGSCNSYGLSKSDYQFGDLGAWCQGHDQCNQRLDTRAVEILDLIDTLDMAQRAMDTYDLLQPHILNEPGMDVATWATHVTCAVDFMQGRRAQLGY